VGDGEKLLTNLILALKVLLGLDIFPRVPKMLTFVDQCNLLMKPKFSGQLFKKYLYIKFHKNPLQWESSCSTLMDRYTDGQTCRS